MDERLNKENLLGLISDADSSVSFKTLLESLPLKRRDRKLLKNLLKTLINEGKILKLRNRRFALPYREKTTEITGTIDLNKMGFGFLIPDDPSKADVFIPPRSLNGAMHKDRVKVKIIGKSRNFQSDEGFVETILERGLKTILGRFQTRKNEICLVPVDGKLPIKIILATNAKSLTCRNGDICAAAINWELSRGENLRGEIVENFEDLSSPQNDIRFVILKNNIREIFHPAIERELAKIDQTKITGKGRIDLRQLDFITVDPSDAKDFDDAVYLEDRNPDGWTLWVSIADVSAFVEDASQIDAEALKRGTSFYFPGFAVPMLPEKISNGFCSLSPLEDKLALTVKMHLTKALIVRKIEIFESIIKSKLRTDYDKVFEVIDSKGEITVGSEILTKLILKMNELSQKLFRKRMEEGGIDFDLPEAKYIYDANGRIIDIQRYYRTSSTQLIEEFMLLANKSVSEFIYSNRAPQIFRVHDEPDIDKLKEFYDRARDFGYQRAAKEIKSSKDLNNFLSSIKDTGRSRTLRYLLLRSMKQAKYSTENRGHYGLGFNYYTHFTSPIRRYPDLVTHRIVKKILKSFDQPIQKNLAANDLEEKARQSSIQERKADGAERDILKIKSVRFMQDKVGLIFPAYISGKTKSGFFIELKDHMVEGFCPAENIQSGERGKKRFAGKRKLSFQYSVGDQVKVKLVRAILEELAVEFSIMR